MKQKRKKKKRKNLANIRLDQTKLVNTKYIRILGIRLQQACNGRSCGEISLKRESAAI